MWWEGVEKWSRTLFESTRHTQRDFLNRASTLVTYPPPVVLPAMKHGDSQFYISSEIKNTFTTMDEKGGDIHSNDGGLRMIIKLMKSIKRRTVARMMGI